MVASVLFSDIGMILSCNPSGIDTTIFAYHDTTITTPIINACDFIANGEILVFEGLFGFVTATVFNDYDENTPGVETVEYVNIDNLQSSVAYLANADLLSTAGTGNALWHKGAAKIAYPTPDTLIFVEMFANADEIYNALTSDNADAFISEQAIPETDCYRFSKLYTEYTTLGGEATQDATTAANILEKFDTLMEQMDEDEVPGEGRLLYVTPAKYTLIKQAEQILRNIGLTKSATINRHVRNLDEVILKRIPSARLKTAYNFTEGYAPAETAKQMDMILIHPKSVIATDKHSYIKLWAPGSHTQGDGYLYQNRKYGDLFVIDTRIEGIKINLSAE